MATSSTEAPACTATGKARSATTTTARSKTPINDVYPDGWLESGGPICTVRGEYGTRHVPDHTGFGGYDLCGLIEPEPVR